MLNELSLTVIAISLLVAMLLAHELGLAAHHRFDRGSEGSTDEGFILSGVLGLLALLLGFSFSMALERHEHRRALVVAEANAISTFSHRVELLDTPMRAAIQRRLVAYGEARVRVGNLPASDARAAARAASDRLSSALNAETIVAARRESSPAITSLVMQALDAMSDIATERRATIDAVLPESVIGLLALYCVFAAAMLGYSVAASGGRHRVAGSSLFVLLALAFATILDLDRPRSGAIQIPQTPMIAVVAALPR